MIDDYWNSPENVQVPSQRAKRFLYWAQHIVCSSDGDRIVKFHLIKSFFQLNRQRDCLIQSKSVSKYVLTKFSFNYGTIRRCHPVQCATHNTRHQCRIPFVNNGTFKSLGDDIIQYYIWTRTAEVISRSCNIRTQRVINFSLPLQSILLF